MWFMVVLTGSKHKAIKGKICKALKEEKRLTFTKNLQPPRNVIKFWPYQSLSIPYVDQIILAGEFKAL